MEVQSNMNILLLHKLLLWIEHGLMLKFLYLEAERNSIDIHFASTTGAFQGLKWVLERSDIAENLLSALTDNIKREHNAEVVVQRWFISTDVSIVVDTSQQSHEAQFLFEENQEDMLLTASRGVNEYAIKWGKCLEENGYEEYLKPFPKDSICALLFRNS
jgi:hypothetical protein